MNSIKINLNKTAGKIKPMHAANNGPAFRLADYESGKLDKFNSNLDEFRASGIPYARTHDSTFSDRYGMEHTIDISAIFPDFDADVDAPESYDFACTDHYLRGCEICGTKIFYRLGCRIEHDVKKYHIFPPKDYLKWARICEHIIRHYTEGWNNGYHMDIKYWEIWNEPDLNYKTPETSPTWQGTKEQFFELYHITATHLKSCFPHLKIGGPAIAGEVEWADMFLSQLEAPLDFFSWHAYASTPEKMTARAAKIRAVLDKYGFNETESILNEWNYVRAWQGEGRIYTHRQQRGIKGASFNLAAMCACQQSSCDMLMYYDARPQEIWCGLFDDIGIGYVTKAYYPFPMFNELYKLGEAAECSFGGDVYACAAKSDNEAAIILTYYNEDDTSEPKEINVDISGLAPHDGAEVERYLLDGEHELSLVNKADVYSDRLVWKPTLKNFDCCLIKIKTK